MIFSSKLAINLRQPVFCCRRIMDLLLTQALLLLSTLGAVAGSCPDGCRCQDTKLVCSGLSDIPATLPSSTTALYFSNCSIGTLKASDLDQFANTLAIFVIKDTALKDVSPGSLDSTTNMNALMITGTQVPDLPDDLFHNLKMLQSLSLMSNRLLVLRPRWFSRLTSLRLLDLSKNFFTSVPVETFHSLPELRSLLLSGNNISHLPKEVFQGLSKLKTLRLNKNALQELSAGTFDDLILLEELSLQNNLITHLPPDLFSKTLNLQKLFLSHNRLTSLPQGIFINLPLLSQISLYKNQLESLEPGLFGPMPLKELWLYDNNLSRVEDDTFRNLTQLNLLVLSRNQITHVSAGSFRGLEKIGEISLHTNLLTSLQAGTFLGLPNLFHISLEHNFLSSLPAGVLQGVNQLDNIDLHNNSFANLPQTSLDALTVATTVLLRQNPWRCDLDILPLREWLRNHPSKANQTLVICESPFRLNGQLIALLDDGDVIPLNSTLQPVLTSTEKDGKPSVPQTTESTSSNAVKTTPVSDVEENTGDGRRENEAGLNNTSVVLIVIAVVSTVIISTVIVSCVCWRRKKRGRGDIGRRNKNSVL